MKKIAFRMTLHKGKKKEYKRRHDNIWPELKKLFIDSGISDYSIYLDEKSYHLFAVMSVKNDNQVDLLAEKKIVQKWWNYMADIMDTEIDNAPVTNDLEEVFTLTK